MRFVREAVRQNLNLTEVANVLQTSQSGVSKQIKDLESELGIQLFIRRGKRITGLTDAGSGVMDLVERVLCEKENLCRAADHYACENEGRLILATTHTQARYALPDVIQQFCRAFPLVSLALRQGSPAQVAAMVANGVADIGIATEALDRHPGLTTFSAYSWQHAVVVPQEHPLTRVPRPSLADIARHRIVTYDAEISGRAQIDAAFADAGVVPSIALTATDADVIKTYVKIGLGVGIVSAMAIEPTAAGELVVLDTPGMFAASTTRIGVRNGAYLRAYGYRMIEMFAPHLTRDVVDAGMDSGWSDRDTAWPADAAE
nr:LysR substrate-binding domain-containing protein [Robbsia betulipollinis]